MEIIYTLIVSYVLSTGLGATVYVDVPSQVMCKQAEAVAIIELQASVELGEVSAWATSCVPQEVPYPLDLGT